MGRTVGTWAGIAAVILGLLGCGHGKRSDYEVIETVEARLPESFGKLTISKDGLHVAYEVARGGKRHVAVDGQEQQGFDRQAGNVRFGQRGEISALDVWPRRRSNARRVQRGNQEPFQRSHFFERVGAGSLGDSRALRPSQ